MTSSFADLTKITVAHENLRLPAAHTGAGIWQQIDSDSSADRIVVVTDRDSRELHISHLLTVMKSYS